MAMGKPNDPLALVRSHHTHGTLPDFQGKAEAVQCFQTQAFMFNSHKASLRIRIDCCGSCDCPNQIRDGFNCHLPDR